MDATELLARYEALGDERDFVAARPLFEQAIPETEDARLVTSYGYLLESHGRNELRQAVALYERAIELDPADDKPHYQLISARAGLREPEHAIAAYEERLAASPGSVREYRFLAQAYLAAHSYAQALEIAESGLALVPDDAALTAVRQGRASVTSRARSPIGGGRYGWTRKTSARSSAPRSCSSTRGGCGKAPKPGGRSSSGTTNAT